jgi:hypothetical protein
MSALNVAQAMRAGLCSLGPAGSFKLTPCREGEGEMTTSGRDAHRPAEAMAPAGSSGSPRSPRTSSPDNQSAVRLIGLAVLIHMLRSRRFYERVTVGAIVVAALQGLGQENRAVTFERLAAWNKRHAQLLERTTIRHARRLDRKAKRHARRLTARANLRGRRT